LLRDELYPIKVDNVHCTAVLDEMGEVSIGATEAFCEENNTPVAKIAWFSRRDIPKAYGLMVVYLTKNSDARRPLSEGFFHTGRESGTTLAFDTDSARNNAITARKLSRIKPSNVIRLRFAGDAYKIVTTIVSALLRS
jgi:hypothetical protein